MKGGYGVDRCRFYGWCKDGLGQQRDDSGGCATMCEDRKEWKAPVHM